MEDLSSRRIPRSLEVDEVAGADVQEAHFLVKGKVPMPGNSPVPLPRQVPSSWASSGSTAMSAAYQRRNLGWCLTNRARSAFHTQ